MVARQPKCWASWLPAIGLAQAITPRPVSALDMAWAPAVGVYRSRTMARAAITPAPVATPCKVRQATSQSMLGASAQPRAATTYRARPASSTGRRPQRSDTGPHTSCEPPKASSRAVSVSWVCATGACSCAVSSGSAGR